MAEVEKFTDGAIVTLMKHNERTLKNDSNKDIIKERTGLNYSIPLDHGGLTDRQYYKSLIENSYLYGRGTKSEDDAITAFSWVVTLPKEVSDYTALDKSHVGYINEEAEKAYFNGALQFVSNRYGAENVFHNRIHYDEGGQPHVHIYVAPRKDLNHDQVHYSINRKSKTAVKTETGRWEYQYRFKLDKEGERIPVKNYAKMSDYYDKKLSCFEVINPVELKHFHPDFAEYLRKNNLPGANSVHTGVTDGKNISVKSLKEFTRTTGMTIDEAKALQCDKDILQGQVISLKKDVTMLQSSVTERDRFISTLKDQLHNMEASVDKSKDIAVSKAAIEMELVKKQGEVKQMSETLSAKEAELISVQKNYDQLQSRYDQMERSLQSYQTELARTREEVKTLQQDQAVNASKTDTKDKQIEALQQQLSSLKEQLKSVEQTKEIELAAKDREIEQLKEEKAVTKEATREWGDTSGWGQVKGWGNVERSDKTWTKN